MRRRDFLRLAGGAAAAAILPSFIFAADKSSAKKSNFVFILIDDMGWADAVCYGSSFYETPNIDKLATEGMLFTDAYAAGPVCSPSRASIMTGKYPVRLNLTDFIGGKRKGKLLPVENARQMPLEEFTVAEALREAGYKTFIAGKWHLGKEPYNPEHQGFDINIGSYTGMAASHFYPKWQQNVPIYIGKNGEYLADRLTDESLKFLDAYGDKPFFLYLSHFAVHTPLEAKERITEKYEAKAAKLPPAEIPRFSPEGKREARQVQDHAIYAAMVQSVDESVGRVMKKLEELNIADNTIVIFFSDNGGLCTSEGSPTSNVPLRAGKGFLYEGGIREPLIVRWPGVVKPGSKCSEPVTSTDFYPTILEMANLPPRPEQHIDGVSLILLLEGKGSIEKRALYWHYPHYSPQGSYPAGAVRFGDYKLHEFYEDGRIELYNLKEDIGEKNDLSAKMPEKAAELKKMLQDWRKSVDAPMPAPNPDYDPRKEDEAKGGYK
jgi:arylsulfatase A-like enzyme